MERRPPLDRPAIVAEAIRLADGDGIEAITMRKLADGLGYKVMSLYNHVASKDELLGLMVDAVAAEIDDPDPETPPMAAVRELALKFRGALVRHPWAPELWNRYMPGPACVAQMESLLRVLAESALAPDLAHHGFHAVNNHVLGYTLQEQAMTLDQHYDDDPEAAARDFVESLEPGDFPHTIEHVNVHLDGRAESSFEVVLDLILDGLVRLDADR